MNKLNLVIELEYDDSVYDEEFIKEITEKPISIITSGDSRVLKFGEVVNLIEAQKKKIYDEGFAAGRKRKKK